MLEPHASAGGGAKAKELPGGLDRRGRLLLSQMEPTAGGRIRENRAEDAFDRSGCGPF